MEDVLAPFETHTSADVGNANRAAEALPLWAGPLADPQIVTVNKADVFWVVGRLAANHDRRRRFRLL